MEEPSFIPPREAAVLTGIPLGTLAAMRYEGSGPRYYKPSPRRVLYKKAELIAWIEDTARLKTGATVHA